MKETVYRIAGDTNLTIALLADAHNVEPKPILKALSSHQPDIIAIVGDILIGYRQRSNEGCLRENTLFLHPAVGSDSRVRGR